jgi:thymidylate synthase (FAD)
MSTRQGSSGLLPTQVGEHLFASEPEIQGAAREAYEAHLQAGVAREQARKDLRLSTYTEAYWKIELRNLLHFLNLRIDDRAQVEIRRYAIVTGELIVSKWAPLVWEGFIDYQRHDTHLSRIEHEIALALIDGSPERVRTIAESMGLLKVGSDWVLARNRECEGLE